MSARRCAHMTSSCLLSNFLVSIAHQGFAISLFQFLRSCLASGVLASASFQGHANLLTHGDIERDLADVAPGGYAAVATGSSLITGWTVGGTSVDLVLSNYGATSSVSIDLDDTPGPGTNSQTFNQIAGETHTSMWDYFRNLPGSNLGVK